MNKNTFSKIEPMLDELTEAELIYPVSPPTTPSTMPLTNAWK